MSGSTYRIGLVMVTASAVASATAGWFTRLIPLDSWTMLTWRGLFASVGVAVVILAVRRGAALDGLRAMNRIGWLFAAVTALAMILFITALRHTTVAHVAVIYATVPFMAAALGWLALGERPSRSAVSASLAALVGVALMVGFGVEGGLFGDLLALGMTMACAVMMVIARRHPEIPLLEAVCISGVMTAAATWPLGDALAVSAEDLLMLAAFGLVNSALGLALFTLGARYLPVIETALITSLDAPLAPLLVWIAFGETPSGMTMAGAVIVFIAVAAHLAHGARARRGVSLGAADNPA